MSHTHKQDVYTFNQNLPNFNAVRVTSENELSSFIRKNGECNSDADVVCISNDTVQQTSLLSRPPPVIRKPDSCKDHCNKKRKLTLSPVFETNHVDIVGGIVTALLPALSKAVGGISNSG